MSPTQEILVPIGKRKHSARGAFASPSFDDGFARFPAGLGNQSLGCRMFSLRATLSDLSAAAALLSSAS